jgi:hypothetical protein
MLNRLSLSILFLLLSGFAGATESGGVTDIVAQFSNAVNAASGVVPVVVVLLGMLVSIAVGWAIVKAFKG